VCPRFRTERVVVAVAPRRVKWLYQVGDGHVRTTSDGDQLRLRQNVPTTLMCRATVERTDFRPDVVVTLGDRDITARTTINATERRPTTVDGFARLPYWTVERQVRWDAAVAGEFHDRNLTCIAVMKHFPPLSSSVHLTIACKPRYTVYLLQTTCYQLFINMKRNKMYLNEVWNTIANKNTRKLKLNKVKQTSLCCNTNNHHFTQSVMYSVAVLAHLF